MKSAAIAGIACLKKIVFDEVKAPYTPAIITQERKKMDILSAHIPSPTNKDHIRPAERNPLYNPWFAAITLVSSKNDDSKHLFSSCLPGKHLHP